MSSCDFTLDENDWRHRTGAFDVDTFTKNMDIVDKLKEIADDCGSTPAHLALQWLLAQPGVSSVIAGAKRADQVNDNVAADAVELTPETLASINVLTAG